MHAARVTKETVDYLGRPQLQAANAVTISSMVKNNGAYAFRFALNFEAYDATNTPVSFRIDGDILPYGLVNPGQALPGTTTLVFPQEWVKTHPGVVRVKVSYRAETSADIVDSLAKQIHVPGIRERLRGNTSNESNKRAFCLLAQPLPPPLM